MSGLDVQVITNEAALARIGEEWDGLFASSLHAPPYLSRAWVEPWWRHFGAARSLARVGHRPSLHVVTVRDGSRLIALAPWLALDLGVGTVALRVLVGIGQETADYGGVLLGDDPTRAAAPLLDHVEGQLRGGRTVLDCTRLAPDDPWLDALRSRFGGSRELLRSLEEEAYPWLDLTAMDDPTRAVARCLKRNDVPRRWRRLDEQHGATFSYHRRGHATADLATFMDLHDRRWAAKDRAPTGLFGPAATRPFLADAAEALDAAGLLRLSFVHAGGRPIAGRFGFEHRGVYHGVKSGWDPGYAEFGPGHLVVGRILQRGAAGRLAQFDFMRGAGNHKRSWTDVERSIGYWVVDPSDHLRPVRQRLMWGALALRARRRAWRAT